MHDGSPGEEKVAATSWDTIDTELKDLVRRASELEGVLESTRDTLVGQQPESEDPDPDGGTKHSSEFQAQIGESISILNKKFERMELLLNQIRA